ncbi:2-oxoglutarate dehydrogenase E1 subunit family protein, partial [Pseudofrankia saprophytica]
MTAPTVPASGPDFGTNEWLVFEIYQQYLADPDSVSPEWREFLSDYHPSAPTATDNTDPESARAVIDTTPAESPTAAAGAPAAQAPAAPSTPVKPAPA